MSRKRWNRVRYHRLDTLSCPRPKQGKELQILHIVHPCHSRSSSLCLQRRRGEQWSTQTLPMCSSTLQRKWSPAYTIALFHVEFLVHPQFSRPRVEIWNKIDPLYLSLSYCWCFFKTVIKTNFSFILYTLHYFFPHVYIFASVRLASPLTWSQEDKECHFLSLASFLLLCTSVNAVGNKFCCGS